MCLTGAWMGTHLRPPAVVASCRFLVWLLAGVVHVSVCCCMVSKQFGAVVTYGGLPPLILDGLPLLLARLSTHLGVGSPFCDSKCMLLTYLGSVRLLSSHCTLWCAHLGSETFLDTSVVGSVSCSGSVAPVMCLLRTGAFKPWGASGVLPGWLKGATLAWCWVLVTFLHASAVCGLDIAVWLASGPVLVRHTR